MPVSITAGDIWEGDGGQVKILDLTVGNVVVFKSLNSGWKGSMPAAKFIASHWPLRPTKISPVEYQREARRTLRDPKELVISDQEYATLLILSLGIAGEAGEIADIIKKAVGHGHPLDVDAVAEEAGDLLWYIANLCTMLDVNLEQVMQANVDKLRLRYPEGFSTEASLNRQR